MNFLKGNIFFIGVYANVIFGLNLLIIMLYSMLRIANVDVFGIVGLLFINVIFTVLFMLFPSFEGYYNAKFQDNITDFKKGLTYLIIYIMLICSMLVYNNNKKVDNDKSEKSNTELEKITHVKGLFVYQSHDVNEETKNIDRTYCIGFLDTNGTKIWDEVYSSKEYRDADMKEFFIGDKMITINLVTYPSGHKSLEVGKFYK